MLSRGGAGGPRGRHWWKKAPPCDEPGFLAAQVFAIAAETGWTEGRILFMPLARLFQYQHCLLRRNGVRANWSSTEGGQTSLRVQLESLRVQWDMAHKLDENAGNHTDRT